MPLTTDLIDLEQTGHSAMDDMLFGKHMRMLSGQGPVESHPEVPPSRQAEAPLIRNFAAIPSAELQDTIAFKPRAHLQKYMLKAEPVPVSCLI